MRDLSYWLPRSVLGPLPGEQAAVAAAQLGTRLGLAVVWPAGSATLDRSALQAHIWPAMLFNHELVVSTGSESPLLRATNLTFPADELPRQSPAPWARWVLSRLDPVESLPERRALSVMGPCARLHHEGNEPLWSLLDSVSCWLGMDRSARLIHDLEEPELARLVIQGSVSCLTPIADYVLRFLSAACCAPNPSTMDPSRARPPVQRELNLHGPDLATVLANLHPGARVPGVEADGAELLAGLAPSTMVSELDFAVAVSGALYAPTTVLVAWASRVAGDLVLAPSLQPDSRLLAFWGWHRTTTFLYALLAALTVLLCPWPEKGVPELQPAPKFAPVCSRLCAVAQTLLAYWLSRLATVQGITVGAVQEMLALRAIFARFHPRSPTPPLSHP